MTHPYGPIPTLNLGSATAKIATDDVPGEIYGHPLAPHWRRYGAMFTDMAMLFAPLVAYSPDGARWQAWLFQMEEPLDQGQQFFAGMLAIVSVAVAINVMNARTGQSPGKRLFGTAVTYPMLDDKGQPWLCRAPFGAHVRRTILNTFSLMGWGLLYLLPLFTKRRRTIGDMWAGTVHITWYFTEEAIRKPEMPAELADLWERHEYALVRRGREWTEAV